MTHFGFVSPPLLGHLNPMRALAHALASRGHRVTFFGIPDVAAGWTDPRCTAVAVGASAFPAGSLPKIVQHLAAPRGLGLAPILIDMMALTRALCRELPAALRRHGIDAIVTDQLEAAGGLVASSLGLPFVSVANALPINRDLTLPPPFTDWPYDASAAGLTRNRWGYQVVDVMMGVPTRVVRRQAEALGLPARGRLDAWLSPYAEVSQLPAALDFPRRLPPTFHSCGPFRDTAQAERADDLLGDGRPLVFASLGTLQGGRVELFRAIAEACVARGLHLVIAHGGRLSPEAAGSFAGSPVVRDFVPQRALLRQAALAITNGGLNTVLDALSAGVPLIVLPVAFEQGAIAARLEHAGAGVRVPSRGATAGPIGRAIDRVLADPGFARRAARCADAIAATGGAGAAAAVIEAVARTGRPVARATS